MTDPTRRPAHLVLSRTDEHAVERAAEHAVERAVERAALLAFAPLHKRVFATAIAVACAVALAAATGAALVLGDPGLSLLAVYFHGYDVSPRGILVGAAWAGFVGFVGGWFVAFARNFVVATWLIYVRARASLLQTRDFLDHV